MEFDDLPPAQLNLDDISLPARLIMCVRMEMALGATRRELTASRMQVIGSGILNAARRAGHALVGDNPGAMVAMYDAGAFQQYNQAMEELRQQQPPEDEL